MGEMSRKARCCSSSHTLWHGISPRTMRVKRLGMPPTIRPPRSGGGDGGGDRDALVVRLVGGVPERDARLPEAPAEERGLGTHQRGEVHEAELEVAHLEAQRRQLLQVPLHALARGV